MAASWTLSPRPRPRPCQQLPRDKAVQPVATGQLHKPTVTDLPRHKGVELRAYIAQIPRRQTAVEPVGTRQMQSTQIITELPRQERVNPTQAGVRSVLPYAPNRQVLHEDDEGTLLRTFPTQTQ
jgi:hypothetical protein